MFRFRLSVAALIVAIIATGLTAQAQNAEIVQKITSPDPWMTAPRDFQGVRFGSTIGEAEVVLGRMKCKDFGGSDGFPPGKRCSVADHRKSFRAKGHMVASYYVFYVDRFVGVELEELHATSLEVYKPPLYDILAAMFEKEYGSPTTRLTIRNHGTYAIGRSNPVGGAQVNNTDIVGVGFDTHTVVWESSEMYALLVSAKSGRLRMGLIETQEWKKLKLAAQAQPKQQK